VTDFFKDKKICYQNFYKFYNRYRSCGKDEKQLLPRRRGPRAKYKDAPYIDDLLEEKVLNYRNNGHNKFVIAEALKKINQ
jgi:hypothetical protein